VLALAAGCPHTSLARFGFGQVVLPARLGGCRLFWVGVLGRAWAFVAAGVVCFRPCRFCLQAELGCSGLALALVFRFAS